MRRLKRTNGQIVSILLTIFFLVYFAATIGLFFLYQEKLFRFQFGPDMTEKNGKEKELVFDKNRVLELFHREKVLEEEQKKTAAQKVVLENLQKQIEIEKGKLLKDREFITQKMKEISEQLKGVDEEEEKNLQRLAGVYSRMKADRVALIFSQLDTPTIANILVRMQDKNASKILGEIGLVDAKRAAGISDLIQGKMKKELVSKVV